MPMAGVDALELAARNGQDEFAAFARYNRYGCFLQDVIVGRFGVRRIVALPHQFTRGDGNNLAIYKTFERLGAPCGLNC